MKHIARMNYEKCNGYMVRFQSRHKITSRFFNANLLGLREAKKAAVEWRDKMLVNHKAMNKTNIPREKFRRGDRCTSPIIGVGLVQTKNGCWAWLARYSVDGTQRTKHFSINKFGYENAFDLACKIRSKHRGILIITDSDLLPCRPKYPHKAAYNV